jgi:hypothetical protein
VLEGHTHQTAIIIEIDVDILADLSHLCDGEIDEIEQRGIGV